jgi:F0F1-type ATP synthase delta subunit
VYLGCTYVFQCEGLKRNQQVCSSLQINRGIMGGLTIDIGEKYIDLSIATRIKKIEALLKDASIE